MNWEYLGEISPRSSGVFCLRNGETTLFQSYALAAAVDGRSIDTRRAELESLEWSGRSVRAVLTSRREQTISLRIRGPQQRCLLNGVEAEVRNGSVPVSFKAGETVEVRLETERRRG